MVCITWPAGVVAQGQGSWGGATGLFQAALVIIGIVFLLWAGVAYLIARGFSSRTMPRLGLAAAITCAPLAYCGLQSHSFNNGLEELGETNRRLVKEATAYMERSCPAVRSLTAPVSVPNGSGLYVQANGDLKPSIPQEPTAPVVTRRMKRDQERYGESFPHLTHQKQFIDPLYWTRNSYVDWQRAGFSFMEFPGRYADRELRRAPLRWWRANTQPDQLARLLEKRFKEGYSHLNDDSLVDLPIETSRATFRLELRDVSTQEDRNNWTSRGQIRLVRASDGAVLAEYVGLAANQSIVFRGYGYSWEKVAVCPGVEQRYMEDGRWNADKFIVAELLRSGRTE